MTQNMVPTEQEPETVLAARSPYAGSTELQDSQASCCAGVLLAPAAACFSRSL